MQSTQVTRTTEDIVAHTAEDANGRYLKSGYAVPSELHQTAVASKMAPQSPVRPATNAASAAAVENSFGFCDRQVSF